MKKHDSIPGIPSQRQLRVAEQVRHALAEIIQRGEVFDPALEGHVITVPEVRMTPDLRLATALVMPLGGKDEAIVVAALNKHAKAFRGAISRRLREMRFAPEIRFRRDDRFDKASAIDKLLSRPEVARDLKKNKDTEE